MDELVYIKRDVKSSPAYGISPKRRTIEQLLNTGFINLDKPKGPTSHQSVAFVKRLLGIKKAGHTGTLDPEVSGVLPILLGSSVYASSFLNKEKEYVGVMFLHKGVEEEKILDAFERFKGVIVQIPPQKSAVARKPRKRMVYDLKVLEIEGKNVLFKARVEAGTYIRKLVHDIGQYLGVGANMVDLRRTAVMDLKEDESITLHRIAEAAWLFKNENDDRLLRKYVLPIEDSLEKFGIKFIWVLDSAVDSICSGAQLMEPGIAAFNHGIKEGETVALMTLKDELIGFASSLYSSEDLMTLERKQVTKTLRIIMPRGTYPKWHKRDDRQL
ncbi:MAG: RNA-guided pseudouridylation complex pseudouridine synthase subunit Cbf5 [Candidatus Micrarchaeota archaeon]|nr:RNA-guided pseudouridylation complex pseudouridine synthase subunit Cbf5 [Candidatus Micrarchaeota archaeon]